MAFFYRYFKAIFRSAVEGDHKLNDLIVSVLLKIFSYTQGLWEFFFFKSSW